MKLVMRRLGNGLGTTIKYTSDAQGTEPQAAAWAQRSSTFDKQLPRVTV
jgi:hypothetical protein